MTETATTAAFDGFAAALQAAAALPAPQLLKEMQSAGRASFAALGLPSRREESWRFTRLSKVEKARYEAPAAVPLRVDTSAWRLADAHLLVFVDGMYSPDLSDIGDLPDGVVVSNLVVSTAAGSAAVANHLGSLAPLEDHPFAALNTAVFADGAFIHLPTAVELDRPIQLLFVSAAADRPILSAPRSLIVAEARSRVTVVEQYVGTRGAGLSCPLTEIVLAEDADVSHLSTQEEGPAASHLAVRQIRLARGSRYSAHAVSLGGALARTDIGAVLAGKGAEASLDGLYLCDGEQQADTHITVRHSAPHCNSHQLYKGILGGSSRTVFNGRIIVDQDAQKTDAKQSNRNLILSDDAVANSNPQLEIFADDVRCTHGSTIGRLDDEAVFYLRTRGISGAEAKRLLTLAFAGEVLDRIPLDELRQRLASAIADRLAAIESEGGSG
jgi:Fe-S cluster assembly protein SufD